MKIAKIISIMKTFTSYPLPRSSFPMLALRVILPSLWGASPHALGKKVGPDNPLPPEFRAPFWPDAAWTYEVPVNKL